LDEINRKILNLLQRNAKMTNAELAERTGLSPAGTLERVRKLERLGIIRGYVALVDPERIDRGTQALVQLSLVKHNLQAIEHFREAVLEMPEVLTCYHIAGEYDFVLLVAVSDMKAYESFVLHKLTTLAEISRIHTNFVLRTFKYETMHHISEDDTEEL